MQAKHMTVEELGDLPDDSFKYELIEGVLVRMAPPNYEHGKVPMNGAVLLGPYLKQRGLGTLVTETGFVIQRDPDVVRSPDMAFVSRKSLEQEPGGPKYRYTPPELVVEVISPNDRPGEVRGKVLDWLRAGTLEAWLLDPAQRTLTVHRTSSEQTTLYAHDTLTSPLFPNWQCVVEELFSYLG